ncbi:MAG TPA: amidase family protein [Povalibacter sp.]|uniref:amidase family protein n=1 Tax=Povalibacter sp. TaxID=1962978 RepID=UPI002C17F056|nr:amidase family protein [Povalibacter sp.]HMN47040.1 amidase family protein [Povalibacter sp.]
MAVHLSVRTLLLSAALLGAGAAHAAKPFQIEEASIESIQDAIRSGETTCRQVVQDYITRARAYNGVCSKLVTAEGTKIKAVPGAVRAGAPLKFPTATLAIDKHVPDFDKYKGLPPDFGRMEPTLSDPGVYQQFGMLVGTANAGQVNALESINIRGERSVTCKGKFDAPPGTPLPKDAPPACEKFRQQPDALEYAAQLDEKYGRDFDTKTMPLYCAPMSFKAVYDTADMRSTGGGDVKYAMDAPPRDSTLVRRLREAGAIIYAHAHNSEYNGGSGDPTGPAKVERPYIGAGGSRETWGGMTCNPYDTERVTAGSSGGSGASVAANLVVCSICETTGGSCRGPANYHSTALIVPTKGMISFDGTIGANPYQDRPGIICRSVKDAATVLDAFRDKKTGTYFDAHDLYTSLPRVIESKTPYLDAIATAKARPLAGMRIGIVRELFVKDNPAKIAVSDGINRELAVLRNLGAELVETVDPRYPDDPAIPNMTFTFNDAIAEVVPFHMPEIFAWQKDGKPEFTVPGWDVTSRKYLVALSTHKAPLPANLNFNRVFGNPPEDPEAVSGYTFAFDFAKYLALRGDASVYDWQTLNANAKYYNDVRRAAMTNWENKEMDIRTDAITYTMKRRDTLRMVMTKVLRQNGIDVLVNPVNPTLAEKIGGATASDSGSRSGYGYGAMLGIPEVFVPAGFSTTVVDASFVLSKDATRYEGQWNATPTRLGGVGLPYNIAFWAEPGQESTLITVASAYESATQHRKSPPGFGPVRHEP